MWWYRLESLECKYIRIPIKINISPILSHTESSTAPDLLANLFVLAISPSSKSRKPEKSKINAPDIIEFWDINIAESAEIIRPIIVKWFGVVLVLLSSNTIGLDK